MYRYFTAIILVTTILCTGVFAYSPVIDPGHGGEDGGAVSKSGVIESAINLEIARRLKLTMCLFGHAPVMTRESDISIHDQSADTLRKKKASDLKNRVALVNSIGDAFLISIHQNTFTDGRYSGAQVFFNGDESRVLASALQEGIRTHLDPSNTRECKPISRDIYLMNKVECPAVLIECGFMTNLAELEKLVNPVYQQKLALIITVKYMSFILDP